MDKFTERKEICRACKNQEVWMQHIIIADLYVLWDTVDEVYQNIYLYKESGWIDIQTSDWIKIVLN